MAARFWVGGSGNWDAADTTHWSATSGGAGGASVPTSADTVTFDANSGTAATATIAAAAVCSALTINKSDLTLLQNFGLTVTGVITLTTGTWNSNGQAVSAQGFVSSNTNARTLTLGASAVTLTGNSTRWDTSTDTNMTITANTATVTFTGGSVGTNAGAVSLNGMSWAFTGGGATLIFGTNTNGLKNLSYTGTAVKTDQLSLSGSLILSGTFTVNGNSGVNRVLVRSLTLNTSRTITCPTTVLSNVDFMDIAGVSTTVVPFSSEVLADSPSHFWKMWDASGASAVDSSGNTRPGTYVGSPTLHSISPMDVDASAFGVTLNGTSQYVSRASEAALHPSAPWTAEIVCKVNGGAGTFRVIASNRDENNNNGWLLYLNDLNKLDLRHGGGGTVIQSAATYAVGTALHIVWGHDGTKFFMYVNKVKEAANPTAAYVAPAATDINIGRRLDNSFFGPFIVQHFAHYASALSGARIAAHYDALSASPSTSWTGGTLVGDAGGNSGITFTTPATQTWQGTAGGNWSDVTKWTSRVPLPQDNVVINAAFAASQTISTDVPRLCKDIDFTGVSGGVTIASASTIVYGSIKLAAGMTFPALGSLFGTWTLRGRTSGHTITSNGITFGVCLLVDNEVGTYTLTDNLKVQTNTGPELKMQSGAFTANGFNVNINSLFVNGAGGAEHGTVNMGSGTWEMRSNSGNAWQATGLTINAGTSIIDLLATSGGCTFVGADKTYYTLRMRGTGNAALTIFGNNTFTNLDVECTTSRSVALGASATQTVTGTLTLQGASGQVLALSSTFGPTTIVADGTRTINAFVTNTTDVRMKPQIVTAPAVTGTAQVGSVLTTDNGTWTYFGTPTYTYQWQRNGANIGGATASTYTLVDADDAATIRCVVTATNAAGNASANSNGVAVTEPAPVNTVAPVVSGSTPVGSVLSVTNGTWDHTGGAPPSYAYQWTRDGANIGGATSSTYTTVTADSGHAVGCKVTVTNTGGSATQASSNTITVASAPLNTVAPVVTGTPKVGSILSTDDGTWSGTGITYSYQWQRNGSNIGGATSNTYTLVDADDGTSVRAVVTATNVAGSASANSNALAVTEFVPVNVTAPVVSGATQYGSLLSVTNGTWTHTGGAAGTTYGYQWTRDGTNIVGATSATYTTVHADIGHAISCKVVATNSGGASAAQAASNSITVTQVPENIVAPAVTGTAVVGSTLSSTDGTWEASPSASFTYQWQRNGSNIGGATANTYLLVDADDGQSIRCRVTATNAQGSASANSNAVTPVEPPPTNSAPPTISGSALPGSVLTATPGTWAHMGGAGAHSFAYQWTRDGVNISGGTSATYTTVPADDDTFVSVKVTATNTGGSFGPVLAASSIHIDQPPTLIVPPTLSGHASPGGSLVCSIGVWNAAPDPTFAFQWQTSLDQAVWTPIVGETRNFYNVAPGDAGLFIRCVVTATNEVGSTSAATSAHLVQGRFWTPRSTDPFYLARLPFHEAQESLSAGAVGRRRRRTVELGWHGTLESAERGSFALAKIDGPFEDLIGHVIVLTTATRSQARSVFAFVHSGSDTVQDLTLTRQLFMRLSPVGERVARCVVEVVDAA